VRCNPNKTAYGRFLAAKEKREEEKLKESLAASFARADW
jgi:hypothetical protein